VESSGACAEITGEVSREDTGDVRNIGENAGDERACSGSFGKHPGYTSAITYSFREVAAGSGRYVLVVVHVFLRVVCMAKITLFFKPCKNEKGLFMIFLSINLILEKNRMTRREL
jgi:hypothetical protein